MMKIIKPRGTGKTRELLEFAKDNNAIFVCHNPIMMRRKAIDYGIVGIDIVGYTDISNEDCNIVIDELDSFVAEILKCNLLGFTMTTED